jgi:ssDNA-specific exonuclease RecJ
MEMNKEKTEKEFIKEQCKIGLEKIEKIYDDFDLLNGALYELSEKLDKEEFAWFYDFWMKFPTYNQMDELKEFLKDLKKEEN